MELEETILNEITQSQIDNHDMYSLTYEYWIYSKALPTYNPELKRT